MAQLLKSCQEVATYALLFGHQEAQQQYELTSEQLNSILNEIDFTQLSMVQSVKNLVMDLSKKVQHTQPIISGFTGVPVFMVSKIIKTDPQKVLNMIEEINKRQEYKNNQNQNTLQVNEISKKMKQIMSPNEQNVENEDNQVEDNKQGYKQKKIKENSKLSKCKKTYQCPDCENEFMTSKEVKEHMKLNHKKKRKSKQFNCQECNQSFKSNKKLQKHMKQLHNQESASKIDNENNKVELFQNTNYVLETNGKKKDKINTPSKSFSCSLCNKVFFHNYYLYIHLTQVHEQKCRGRAPLKPSKEETFKLKCQNCDYLAEDQNQLQAHEQNHQLIHESDEFIHQNSDLKCVICEQEMQSIQQLTEHMQIEH